MQFLFVFCLFIIGTSYSLPNGILTRLKTNASEKNQQTETWMIRNVRIAPSLAAISDKDVQTITTVESNNSPKYLRDIKTNAEELDDVKPIKLNRRQSLLMKQVLGTYALDDVQNPQCKNHSLQFKSALRSFQPWALKMFDSSSKLQSGILAGNAMDFGSFTQCIHIFAKSNSGKIRGKHCMLKITPTLNIVRMILEFRNVSRKRFEKVERIVRDVSLYWSVCVPDSCRTKDVLFHFKKQIDSISEGLDLNVSLTDMDCYSLKDQPKFTYIQQTIISSFFGIGALIIMCTFIDIRNHKKSEKSGALTNAFSAYSNAKFIFVSTCDDKAGLDCLHGIRFLSICYVVLGHRFLMTLFFPAVNSLDVMDWLLEYSSTFIIGGTVCVDSFFMLSGILVAYYTMEHLSQKKGKISWTMFYLHRYMRITPPFAVVVLVHATLLQHFGSGPQWRKMLMAFQKPCQYFWWSAIFHVQNYVNPKYLCVVPSWYLTCDMQFYLISPFLIYPIWKWPKFGWTSFVLIYILSVLINFYSVWVNEYEASELITNRLIQTKFFTSYYILPHVRVSTYVLGIGCGCIFYQVKNLKIKMNPVTITVGWIWSTVLLLTAILSNHIFQLEDHEYNRLETSLFLSMVRSAWTLGLIWVVWACKTGYGGPVNHFLSHPVFQVLGKIAYSMFLWHWCYQFLGNASLKLPMYFSDFHVVYTVFGDLLLNSVLALLFTICVECPSVKLGRMAFKKRKGLVRTVMKSEGNNLDT